MRLLVLTPALDRVLAVRDPAQVREAIDNPTFAGMAFAYTDALVYEGDPAPAGLVAIDRDIPAPPAAPESLVEYSSRRRWEIEIGGTTWNGFPVATDDRSKTLVSGELNAIALGVRVDGEPFKFADGIPRPLTNAEMQAVAVAMRAHVKRTFSALFGVLAGIEVGSITAREHVDAALAGNA